MTETAPQEKCQTLTVPEAGQLLGIGRNAAYQGVANGEIPVLRIGKRLVVPRAALERMLANVTGEPAEA